MLFKPKKKDGTFEKEKNAILLPVIFLVVGILVGYLLYTMSNRIFLIIFSPIFFFAFSTLLNPTLAREENLRKQGKVYKDHLNFYRYFLEFSILEGNTQNGFKRAVDELEISDLKDTLTEYDASLEKKALPLSLTGSRTEAQLIDQTYRLLQCADNSPQDFEGMKNPLQAYEKELKPRKYSFDANSLVVMFLVVYVICFVLCLFTTGNA